MTTQIVQTLTDELLEEIESLAERATGGDWEYRLGLVRTLPDADGYVPVAVAPNAPKNWRGQRDTNMQYIATASPATVIAMAAEIRTLRAENKSLHERIDDPEFAPKYSRRLIEQLRAENAGLRKAAGRLKFVIEVGITISQMNGTGMPMVYQCQWHDCRQIDWYPSAIDAIDAAMAMEQAK